MAPRPLHPGIYVPTVAFFNPTSEELDIPTVEKHASYLASTGIAGLVVQGSNGEAVHLDREERKAITRATRRALDSSPSTSSIPIIVGTGAQSTRETITLCKDAAEAGGDYAIILPPCYYKGLVNNDALLEHFRIAASESPIPVMIYNYPGAAAGVDLTSDDVLALAEHPNIIGVKLTCGNTGKLARIAAGAKKGFMTLGGSCDFTLQTLIAGGQGVIAGTANVIPRTCVEVMKLYEAGRVAEAQKLQAIVARADWEGIKAGFVGVKTLLQVHRGYGGPPRRPCVAHSPEEVTALTDGFAEAMEVEKSLEK
ncbi:hypothetical protein DTO212C5_7480 [Paecilomyces variotii]|nr:hypothetical protein DTO212C5_7480 [Paecilomyces variotii]